MCKFINKEDFKVSSFYRLPKALMSERYDSLMLESKVAYSLLLDMVSLSIENDWVNEKGEVFVKIKRKDLMKKLGVKGTQKMAKIMSELKEYNLIFEEKVGLGRCNKIFLYDLDGFENQNSDDTNSNDDDFENQKSDNLKAKVKSFVFQSHNKTNINKTKYNKTDLTNTQSSQELDDDFDSKNLESFDYDMETLDTARELLGWSVDYKDANTLLNDANGNLYVLDLAYEKMISVKGKIRNTVGYLKTLLCNSL